MLALKITRDAVELLAMKDERDLGCDPEIALASHIQAYRDSIEAARATELPELPVDIIRFVDQLPSDQAVLLYLTKVPQAIRAWFNTATNFDYTAGSPEMLDELLEQYRFVSAVFPDSLQGITLPSSEEQAAELLIQFTNIVEYIKSRMSNAALALPLIHKPLIESLCLRVRGYAQYYKSRFGDNELIDVGLSELPTSEQIEAVYLIGTNLLNEQVELIQEDRRAYAQDYLPRIRQLLETLSDDELLLLQTLFYAPNTTKEFSSSWVIADDRSPLLKAIVHVLQEDWVEPKQKFVTDEDNAQIPPEDQKLLNRAISDLIKEPYSNK